MPVQARCCYVTLDMWGVVPGCRLLSLVTHIQDAFSAAAGCGWCKLSGFSGCQHSCPFAGGVESTLSTLACFGTSRVSLLLYQHHICASVRWFALDGRACVFWQPSGTNRIVQSKFMPVLLHFVDCWHCRGTPPEVVVPAAANY
jgi:hypothetical protein